MKRYRSEYPEIHSKLIEKLRADYPNKLPKTDKTSFELGYLIGQQSIIDKLDFEMREQNEGYS